MGGHWDRGCDASMRIGSLLLWIYVKQEMGYLPLGRSSCNPPRYYIARLQLLPFRVKR